MPSLLQLGLNSTNICYQGVGELELMVTVATRAAQEICPHGPVSEYSSTIGKFVKLYGGGAPFSLIHFVASFAPTHGCSVNLGKDFFEAVTDVVYSQTCLYGMTRVALLLTNLTAPDNKQIDGYSRLLLRSDILCLKATCKLVSFTFSLSIFCISILLLSHSWHPAQAKKKKAELDHLEDALRKAWDQLVADGLLDQVTKNRIYGRFCVRAILLLLNKSKQGREDASYTSLDEIQDAMAKELKEKGKPGTAPGAASTTKPPEAALTVDQAHDPMYLADRKLGLTLGSVWSHKEYPGFLWVLQEKGAHHVKLLFTDPIKGEQQELEVGALDLIHCLKPSKAKLPTVLGSATVEGSFANVACEDEVFKCEAFLALASAYNELDVDSNTLQVLHGTKLRMFSKIALKKGQLTLVPVTDKVSSLTMKEPESGEFGRMKHGTPGQEIWIAQPKLFKVSPPEKDGPPTSGILRPTSSARPTRMNKEIWS